MFFKKKGPHLKVGLEYRLFFNFFPTRYCLLLKLLKYTKIGLASKLSWSNGFSTGFLFTTLLHRRTDLFDFPALALDKSVSPLEPSDIGKMGRALGKGTYGTVL